MVAPRNGLAPFDDLADLERVEVIHGAIVEKEPASFEHGSSQGRFFSGLDRRFQRKPGATASTELAPACLT
ncbi:MAG: hypothetical protein SFX73_29700 [Kofleriaceae bacterium]|nr:hypothetical protein [Kofleriaceae bacterium]